MQKNVCMLKRALIFCFIFTVSVSCKRSNCITYGISGLYISNNDSVIYDTMIRVFFYQNNKTYQTPIDSAISIYSNYPAFYMHVELDTTIIKSYECDILCKLYPSGRIYKISDIQHENAKSDKPGFSCVNKVHYNINGNPKVIQGYLGMGGFTLDVPY